MIKVGYVECPDYGKQTVEVEINPHVELCARYAAKCPKCGKRLPVSFN